MGYGNLKKVLLCNLKESYFKVKNHKLHNLNQGIDKERALIQFGTFKNTLLEAEVPIVSIPELKNHPNSIFVRDTAAITKDGFIRLRMGLETRRGEEEWMGKFLKSLDITEIGRVEPPGTAEGGDIIIGEKTVFIGISSRTNKAGAEQTARILQSHGYKTRIAKFKGPFLHIGGGMSLIGKNMILHCKNSFPEGFFDGFKEIKVECNDFIGGNVIAISEKKVIASESNRKVIDVLHSIGITAYTVNISEFVKGNGGPSCMILPLS
jgi:dimethylargininase